MLSPFRQIRPFEQRKAARVSLCLSAVMFLVYLCTLSGSICPGASAKWVAWVSGADVRDVSCRCLQPPDRIARRADRVLHRHHLRLRGRKRREETSEFSLRYHGGVRGTKT